MPPLIGDFGFSIQATLPWLFTSQSEPPPIKRQHLPLGFGLLWQMGHPAEPPLTG